MTDIHGLLERATTEITPPHPQPPVTAIRRAAARRQGLAGAAALSLVAAAAVGIPLALPAGGRPAGLGITSSPKPPPAPPQPGTSRAWPAPPGNPAGIAVGLGSAWVGSGSEVQQRDPVSGRVLRTIPQDGTVTGVAVGIGRVWVITVHGTNDSAQADVSAIDPSNHSEETLSNVDVSPLTLAYSAFFDRSLWLAGTHRQLLRVTPEGRSLSQTSRLAANQPQSIASTGRRLWVQEEGNQLTPVRPSPGSAGFRFGPAVEWPGPIFAGAQVPKTGTHMPGMLWTTDGTRLIGLAPSLLKVGASVAQVVRLQGSGRPSQVAGSSGGIFAVTVAGVDFFSRATMRSGYRTTAHYRISPPARVGAANRPKRVGTIAADGDGVLIQDGTGAITYWVPPDHAGH